MSVAVHGIIYGLRTLDATTLSTIELGYVGKTRQRLRARETQHREDQPWEDIIVGSAYIISEGRWTEDELSSNEAAMIRLLKPRYNVECNGLNADRTSPTVAVEQRRMRDRARGLPLWREAGLRPVRRSVTQADVRDAVATPEPKVFRIGGQAFEVAQFPVWDAEEFSRALNRRPQAAMHKGHHAVLRQMNAEVTSPAAIARATGYSERQVYNLLCDLVNQFGLVRRPHHGKYILVRERL